MDKNRFEIQIWSVRKNVDWLDDDIQLVRYSVSEVETFVADNLSDVLYWLNSMGVTYMTLNKYIPGGYSPHVFDSGIYIIQHAYVRTFANVFHNGSLLEFTQLPPSGIFSRKPDFTACGYRFKNVGRNYRVKSTHTRRNPKHRNVWGKDAAHSYINAVECENMEYDIPNQVLDKWKRQAADYEYDIWDGKRRTRNSQSWKSQKKKHQWNRR